MADAPRTLAGLESEDPVALMRAWLDAAQQAVPVNFNAAALATATDAGVPDVRYVLIKEITEAGAFFYTNRGSAKGQQLQGNPQAALALYWRELGRQLRIRGSVSELDREDVAAYFTTRGRASQLGAWASRQSAPLADAAELQAQFRLAESRFSGRDVDLPAEWAGYCLEPGSVEFWQEGEHRMHERLRFMRGSSGSWTAQRLYP